MLEEFGRLFLRDGPRIGGKDTDQLSSDLPDRSGVCQFTRVVRAAPHIDNLPRGEDAANRKEMVASGAVTNRMGAGRVGGDHATNGTAVATNRVDGDHSSSRSQCLLHDGEPNAWLDADRVGSDVENSVQVPGEIDDDARPERLACQTSS